MSRDRTREARLRWLRAQLVDKATRMMKRSRLGREPEDIVHAALERLERTMGDEMFDRPDAQLLSLASRQVHFTFLTFLKRAAHRLEVHDDGEQTWEHTSPDLTPEDLTGLREERARLHDALSRLRDVERRFVTRAMAVGVPRAKEECGWPPKSEYYVLRKLLARLRSQME